MDAGAVPMLAITNGEHENVLPTNPRLPPLALSRYAYL